MFCRVLSQYSRAPSSRRVPLGELSFPQRTFRTRQLTEAAARETFGRPLISLGVFLACMTWALSPALSSSTPTVGFRTCFSRGPEISRFELSESRVNSTEELTALGRFWGRERG